MAHATRRILVVDDDEQLRRLLERILEREGYVVVTASDGRAALRALDDAPVDLVVTDLIMPEMEGIETIRSVRSRHPDARIVAVSGGGRAGALGILNAAAHLGADRTLEKPFTPGQLVAVVREVLGETPPGAG
jgi:DNA-binding response OmpR family regulator